MSPICSGEGDVLLYCNLSSVAADVFYMSNNHRLKAIDPNQINTLHFLPPEHIHHNWNFLWTVGGCLWSINF